MGTHFIEASPRTIVRGQKKLSAEDRKALAFDHARLCVERLRSHELRDALWRDILQQCIRAGVTYESLGTTVEEIDAIYSEICLDHAWQMLILIREERRHRRSVSSMVNHMKSWLVKGGLTYRDIKATDEEICLFIEILPEKIAS